MIYFIQDSGLNHIKIGFTDSNDPIGRMKSLQTGSPAPLCLVATMPGSREDELSLHRRFAKARVHGEWFKPVPDLLEFLVDLRTDQAVHDFQFRQLSAMPCRNPNIWPLRIYLAGKITKRCWRHTICAPGLAEYAECGYFPSNTRWPILRREIFDTHDYTGPFFASCDHGCYHGDDEHGNAASGAQCEHDALANRPTVQRWCLEAIQVSDLLFAWIDSLDCYGTIVEIGYAAALGKRIWVAGPRNFRDMWFAYQAAHLTWRTDMSPRQVLSQLLEEYHSQLADREYVIEPRKPL